MMARPIRVSATAQRRFFPAEGRFFCLMVARWDATFCSFRGIGRGGTASPSEVFAGTGAPAAYDMRGGNAPSALPTSGRSAPPPRVTFVSRRKSPKACQGRCPWTPLGGRLKSVPLFSPIPPATLCVAPPRKGRVPLRVEGFATLRWCGQLAFLSLRAPWREHPLLSNRGAGAVGLMVTEGWERMKFGFCKTNSALFWQQIIHK